MAWFSLAKLALNAGTHIYKKRQETKMAMADAQHMHAKKMARGEEQYQGKLLEARQSDWKDEAVLIMLNVCPFWCCLGVWSPAASKNKNRIFDHSTAPIMDKVKDCFSRCF